MSRWTKYDWAAAVLFAGVIAVVGWAVLRGRSFVQSSDATQRDLIFRETGTR